MNFEVANSYAEQIKQGGAPELFPELTKMCIPYTLCTGSA